MGQNDIQEGGLNAIIQRRLNIKGDLPPSPTVGPEIIPILALEVDRPEWLFLSNERRMWFEVNQDPPAGQRVNTAIHNPAGSGVLVVVESITIQSTTHIPFATVRFADFNVTEATFMGGGVGLFSSVPTDFRFNDQQTGATQGSVVRSLMFQTVNGMGGAFLVDLVNPMNAPPADVIQRTGPIILPPGWKVGCQFGLDVIICCGYRWRERVMEPPERPINSR